MKFLITILLIYLLYLLAKKYIFPKLMPKLIQRLIKYLTGQQIKSNQYFNHDNKSNKKEGEVTIKKTNKKPDEASKNTNFGEYTDYEEID